MKTISLILFASFTLAACAGSRPRSEGASKSGAEIAWRPLGAAAFEEAEREQKLVLLDVGMEGCTACRWMDEDTYRDPRVVALVNTFFVPLSVDSEARPDIGQRYVRWGWPATIILSPTGEQLLALRGNRRPRHFLSILHRVIVDQAKGDLSSGGLASLATPPPRGDPDLRALASALRSQLELRFDSERGGWSGKKIHLPLYEPVAHALYRARVHGDDAARARALLALEKQAQLLDPVWGGIFVAARGDRWEEIIPEKRMAGNLGALTAWSDAYRLTGDRRFLERAREVERYLRRFMRLPGGAFATSQEDRAPRLPTSLSAADYYGLDDAARRRFGVPPIDHAAYTGMNARAIIAFVHLYQATGDPEALRVAQEVAGAMAARQHPEGWFSNLTPSSTLRGDRRMRPVDLAMRPYLEPQGLMGLALLELVTATGDPSYLEAARRLAVGLRTTLEDHTGGGFWARGASPLDAVLPRKKPREANASVARFLFLLGKLPGEQSHRRSAIRALRAIAPTGPPGGDPQELAALSLLATLVVDGVVEATVVGERGESSAEGLFAATRAITNPRVIAHFEKPGRYPKPRTAALYLCDENACSQPITDPEEVKEVFEANFIRP